MTTIPSQREQILREQYDEMMAQARKVAAQGAVSPKLRYAAAFASELLGAERDAALADLQGVLDTAMAVPVRGFVAADRELKVAAMRSVIAQHLPPPSDADGATVPAPAAPVASQPPAAPSTTGPMDLVCEMYATGMRPAVPRVRLPNPDFPHAAPLPTRHHVPAGETCAHAPWGASGGAAASDIALNALQAFLPGNDGGLASDGSRLSAHAVRLHQAFMREFLLPMPPGGGVVRASAIRDWLRTHGAERPD